MRLTGGIRPPSVLAAVAMVVPLSVTGVALAGNASAATPTCTSIHVVKGTAGIHSSRYMRLPSTSSGATSCQLGVGNSGEGVYTLQRSLHYCIDSSLTVDSSYGPATKAAVKKAQKAAGMSTAAQDGIYGPRTHDAITFAVFTTAGGGSWADCQMAWG